MKFCRKICNLVECRVSNRNEVRSLGPKSAKRNVWTILMGSS